MSRTIFAGVLACSLAALGCGSKPDPQPVPDKPLDPQPPAPKPPDADAKGGLPPIPVPPAPKASWEPDVTKHTIPATPVSGSAGGAEFVPTVATIEGGVLSFRTLKSVTQELEREIAIRWKVLPGQKLEVGRKVVFKSDAPPDPMQPDVWVRTPDKFFSHPAQYALTLELGANERGKVSGKVYLSLPDEAKTFVAGAFTAEVVRGPTEPPAPYEVPYVAGTIALAGAKPGAEVRAAYSAFDPNGAVYTNEVHVQVVAVSPEDAPRVDTEAFGSSAHSRIVSGDGGKWPLRYEHTKLPPGRYLMSAAVVGGPAVWKWVDVPANGSIAENFALDATKLGGVEVQVPADAKGKVLFAPADDPTKPALHPVLFEALALQVIRKDAEIVAGRAKIADLGPGKYEVRAGDLRGFVDVVPGKTVDLVLTPKK